MSVNKVILIGRLCKDPEVRYMTSGEAVANCSIACNEKWKNKAGEKQESVEYINLVFYRRLAEIAGEYLKKGSQIYVEGKLQTRKWQTKEGQDRYTTEIVVNEMTMLGGKSSGSGNSEENQPAASSSGSDAATAKSAPAAKNSFDNFDDDIPFAAHGMPGAGVSWRAL